MRFEQDRGAGPASRRASLPGTDLSAHTHAITLGAPISRHSPLAKPNYSFEKRQREIAKKKEKDEKSARKREAAKAAAGAAGDAAAVDDSTPSAT